MQVFKFFLVLAESASAFCTVPVSTVRRSVAKPNAAQTRMNAVEQPESEK